jgi:hypothetical protein
VRHCDFQEQKPLHFACVTKGCNLAVIPLTPEELGLPLRRICAVQTGWDRAQVFFYWGHWLSLGLSRVGIKGWKGCRCGQRAKKLDRLGRQIHAAIPKLLW